MAGILLVVTECMIPEKALKENILSISYEKISFFYQEQTSYSFQNTPFIFLLCNK